MKSYEAVWSHSTVAIFVHGEFVGSNEYRTVPRTASERRSREKDTAEFFLGPDGYMIMGERGEQDAAVTPE